MTTHPQPHGAPPAPIPTAAPTHRRTIGEVYDAIQTIQRWELQLSQVRDKLRFPEKLDDKQIASLKIEERGLMSNIDYLRDIRI